MAPSGKSVCLLGLILCLATVTPESTTAASHKAPECFNGGTSTAGRKCCMCPPHFSGCTCAIISNTIIPDFLNRTITIAIEINKTFEVNYTSTSSAEYQNLSQTFIEEMTPIYQGVVSFKDVVSITFTEFNGTSSRSAFSVSRNEVTSSVLATHVISVEVSNTDGHLNTTFEELNTAFEAVKKCSLPASDKEGCPSFEVGTIEPPEAAEFDHEAFCNATVGPDFKDYFNSEIYNGVLMCFSDCVRDKPCEWDGACEVTKDGYTCYCQYGDQYWYLEPKCSVRIHKTGFYSGVAVGAIVLLVTAVALSAYLTLTRRAQRQKKDVKQALVAAWMEDDSASRTHTPSSGGTDNYDQHIVSSYWQQNQGSTGKQEAYSNN